MQRFHRGAFELAIELNQEILPIILCDTWTGVPRDAYWFEPYHAVVRALPRVTPQNFDYSLGSVALMQHCEKIVRDALQKQLDELNTPRILRRKVERLYRYQGKFVEKFVALENEDSIRCSLVLDPVVPRNGFVLDLGCGYGSRRIGSRMAPTSGRFSALIMTKIKSASRNTPCRKIRASDFKPATFLRLNIRRATRFCCSTFCIIGRRKNNNSFWKKRDARCAPAEN